jgi:hypothetical protein
MERDSGLGSPAEAPGAEAGVRGSGLGETRGSLLAAGCSPFGALVRAALARGWEGGLFSVLGAAGAFAFAVALFFFFFSFSFSDDIYDFTTSCKDAEYLGRSKG